PLVDPDDVDADRIPWVDPDLVDELTAEEDDREADADREDGDGEDADEDSGETDPSVPAITREEVVLGEESQPPTVQRVVAHAETEDVVVLRGGHGTGKTTLAYRAGRELEQRGYTVRVPNLGESASVVKHRLTRDADDGELALVVSYDRRLLGTAVGGEEFQTLQSWLEEGVCDTVIVEVREEQYTQFESTVLGELSPSDVVAKRSFTRETIRLSRFDSRVPLVAISEWVYGEIDNVDALADDADESPRETFDEILRLSRGNSEVTKVAAKFAFAEGYSLEEVSTHDALIEQDIEHLIGQVSDEDAWRYELLFTYLAVAGELRTRDVWELANIEWADLRAVANDLQGYLGRELREKLRSDDGANWDGTESGADVDDVTWRLSPSIYGDVTVRRTLEAPETETDRSEFRDAYGDLRTLPLDGDDPPTLRRNVARNLADAYEAVERAQQRDSSALPVEADEEPSGSADALTRERVVTEANWLIEQILADDCGSGAFTGSLLSLSFGGVPVDLSYLDAHEEMLIDGA
ncbi:MAG: hypothetical protein ABEH80_02430, partial [Halobaculum sp.]